MGGGRGAGGQFGGGAGGGADGGAGGGEIGGGQSAWLVEDGLVGRLQACGRLLYG